MVVAALVVVLGPAEVVVTDTAFVVEDNTTAGAVDVEAP